MKKKLRVILIVLLIFVLVQWNKKLMPERIEITDLELIRVIGLDNETKNNAQITLVRNKLSSTTESSSEGGSGSENSSPQQDSSSVMTIIGKTFDEISRKMQTYTEKEIPGGHVDYFLIGEDTAITDITQVTNFLAGDNELRSSGKVYIVKESSAEDFLKKVAKLDYKLADKLDNMQLELRELSYVSKFTLRDLLKALTKEEQTCLIPTLQIVKIDESTNDKNESSQNDTSADTENIDFDFGGYAVLKNKKVIKFLDNQQSLACNMVMNKFNSSILNVKNDSGENVALGVKSSHTNIKFEFDGDELKKVIIKNEFESNFEEASPNMEESVDQLQKVQSDIVKSQIEEVVQVSKDMDVDFLQILDKLRLKHPYKYEKIKDDWNEIWKNVEVEVIVESKIKRSYDVIS